MALTGVFPPLRSFSLSLARSRLSQFSLLQYSSVGSGGDEVTRTTPNEEERQGLTVDSRLSLSLCR